MRPATLPHATIGQGPFFPVRGHSRGALDGTRKGLSPGKILSESLVFLPKGTKEEDIASYNINPSAKNTIILWNTSSVKSNFVDVDPAKMSPVTKAVDSMLKS